MIHDLLLAVGFERFEIRFNHRMLLGGFLESMGLEGQSAAVLRALDKVEKRGREKVVAELAAQGVEDAAIDRILSFAEFRASDVASLSKLEDTVKGSEAGALGFAQVRGFLEGIRQAGVTEDRLLFDASIARGLDYYTGIVFETMLLDLPGIGSVCSGGRYDDLASLYTKELLPGIGASLGLDRLLAAMRASKTPASS